LPRRCNGRCVMKTNRVIVGLVLLLGSGALADETVSVSRATPEKTAGLYNALEIAVGGGYSQGVGNVGAGVPSLTDSGGGGAPPRLGVGWGVGPPFLFWGVRTGGRVFVRAALGEEVLDLRRAPRRP